MVDGRSAIRRLALARLLATGGGVATNIAVSYAIYDRTRSTLWSAAFFLISYAGYAIVQPFAGMLADRYDRRRLMISSDLGLAALLVVLAFVTVPAGILVLMAFVTAAGAVYLPASRAAVPNIVGPEDLTWANGLLARAFSVSIVAGPVLGAGLLPQFGVRGVVLVSALTCVASAGLSASLRGDFRDHAAVTGDHDGVMAGVRFLLREKVLLAIVIAEVVALSGSGLAIVADAPLALQFGRGQTGYAALVVSWGIGMIVGAWAAGRLRDPSRELAALLVGMAFQGVFVLLVWPVGSFLVILLLLAGGGAGMGVIETVRQGVMQRRTPDEVRGRAFSAAESVGGISFAVSFVAAGPAVQVLGAQRSYGVGGITFIAGAITVALLAGRDAIAGTDAPA